MDFTKKIKRFKLLSPTRGFADWITQSGQTAPSVLHSRIVFSWLAYRSRKNLGSSNRAISRELGLHPKTVALAVNSLSGLIERRSGEWVATEPPEGLLITRRADESLQHWSDGLAYLTLLLPRKGAVIKYPTTNRKFGLNHCILFSFLIQRAKNSDGMVRRFTMAGAAKLFDLDPKTISAITDDLLWLRFIKREDLGRCSDITVETKFTDDQLAFFEPKAETIRQVVEPKEKQPRPLAVPYQYRGDAWDDCRRLCEKLMPQSVAETAFQKARRLGDSPDRFSDELQRVKGIHDQNVKSGKVGKGNFGKYLNACYDNRLAVIVEEERKQRVEAFMW